jgi:hypothetical protein
MAHSAVVVSGTPLARVTFTLSSVVVAVPPLFLMVFGMRLLVRVVIAMLVPVAMLVQVTVRVDTMTVSIKAVVWEAVIPAMVIITAVSIVRFGDGT